MPPAEATPGVDDDPVSTLVPEIIFHGVDRSPWIEDHVADRLRKLERFAAGITRCHVTLKQEQASHAKGNIYSALVEVRLPPQHDLVATKQKEIVEMPEQLLALINSAFGAIERQVKRTASLRRQDQTPHREVPHGLVEKLFDDYGFIRTIDADRQVYFHRNSVLHGDFERLALGTEVRFSAEDGEQGPQASSVQIVSKTSKI